VVRESVTATLENQRIARLLTDLRRNALRYLLLLDPQTLSFYKTDHESLQESLDVLEALPPQTEEIRAEIATLRRAAAAVISVLESAPSASAESEVDAGFQRMDGAAGGIATGMRVFINGGSGRSRRRHSRRRGRSHGKPRR
jgi:hypothetical protein